MSSRELIEPGQAQPIDWTRHTMGSALARYLELKVHSLAQQRDWRRITVVGEYDRSCIISTLEKDDKLFNWQRPTATVVGDQLTIKCFPGRDYVYHYALMIATFLALKDRYRGHVFFTLPQPDTCDAAVARISIDLSGDDAVILGWGVAQLAGSRDWSFGDGYGWKRINWGNTNVTFIGFLHSIWGDVAGRVVKRLALLGARRVLYVGKVGTLDPALAPNSVLATGDRSLLADGQVFWEDFFDGQAALDPMVVWGHHVTSPSTLLENWDWLRRHQGYLFVDPEIGPMGAAASQARIQYGYLHVVSNNLARRYSENLSNERLPVVREARVRLLVKAKAIIEQRLRQLSSDAAAGSNP